MATGGIYQDLADVVTCEICYENFEGRDPRVLPCSHGFCRQCIQGVLDALRKRDPTSDVMPCPICQSTATIPRGKPVNLPSHFYSTKIQDIINKLEEKSTKCNSCKKKVEVSCYCFQCASPMCSSCKTKHDHCYQNHVHVNVTGSTIADLVCTDHDKHVEAFCVDCSRAVCSIFSFGDHYDHRICDFICNTEESGGTLIEMLKAQTDAADKELVRISILQFDFNMGMDSIRHQLDSHLDDVIELLRRQHKSFLTQLQQTRDDVNRDLDKSQTLIEDAKKVIAELQIQTASWSRPLPTAPEVGLTGIHDLIADIKKQIPSTDVSVRDCQLPVYEPILAANMSLGKLWDKMPHGRYSKRINEEPDLRTHSTSKNRQKSRFGTEGRRPSVRAPQLIWQMRVGGALSGIRGLDVLQDGNLVAGDHHGRVRVFDRTSGKELQNQRYGLCKGGICDVSVNRTKGVLVAVGGGYSAGTLHTMEPCGSGYQHQQHKLFNNPETVACTQDGHFIVVCNGQTLYKYNQRGQQIWRQQLSYSPRYMAVDHQNRIIISDTEAGRVRICDKDGQEMFSFPADTAQRKLKPCDISVDSKDNIIVCDDISSEVLMYDNRGVYIRQILKVDDKPRYVVMCDDNQLALYVGDTLYMYGV